MLQPISFAHKVFTISPVTNPAAGAYATGDQIGAAYYELSGVTPADNRKAPIGVTSMGWADKGKNASVNFNVIFFNDIPTTVTSADNDPYNISGLEFQQKMITLYGQSTPSITLANATGYWQSSFDRVMQINNNAGKLYVAITAIGAFSIAGANDLKLTIVLKQLLGY